MAGQRLDASGVKSPTQLVAATMVLFIVVVPSLVAGAATVSEPPWLSIVFACAAVAYAPAALFIVFLLLTKHRTSMLDDDAVSKLNTDAMNLAPKLDRSLRTAGIDLVSLMAGKSIEDVANELKGEIKTDLNLLLSILSNLQGKGVSLSAAPPPALLEAAKGLMAEHRWGEAARYLEEYVISVDDWQVYWSLGVARGNEHGGASSDLSALRAYGEAIALSPETADPNNMARLFSYKGAMLKRLGRLDEAEFDLLLAKRIATRKFEMVDIAYNLACVYAMMGRKHDALGAIRSLKSLGGIRMVLSHLDDYFNNLKGDVDFRREIEFAD